MAVLLSLEFDPERTPALADSVQFLFTISCFFYSTSMFSRTGCHLGTRSFNSGHRLQKAAFLLRIFLLNHDFFLVGIYAT
ncbi:MAG: hypothetical protein WBW01_14355, partial [Terriglobales bacterium]